MLPNKNNVRVRNRKNKQIWKPKKSINSSSFWLTSDFYRAQSIQIWKWSREQLSWTKTTIEIQNVQNYFIFIVRAREK